VHDELRPVLFGLAYRMLGSVSEAEDIVQEAYVRLELAGGDALELESPKAWLSRVVTRLSIDHLRSARVRREQYVGEWLPEPLVGDAYDDLELADTVSQALLVVLETLSPVERAVFVLREAFDLPFAEIAQVVGKSEDHCRQLAVRARRRVQQRQPRFTPSRERREELAKRFFAACQEGDLEALTRILAADVALHGDGGGNAPATARPVFGRARVAAMLIKLAALGERFGVSLRRVSVNGQPGGMYVAADGVVNVISLDIVDEEVQTVRSILNPDKLRHVGPTADVRALLRSVPKDRN
jgi:RNA polymerase sigma-70 factor (ECF subfamily)